MFYPILVVFQPFNVGILYNMHDLLIVRSTILLVKTTFGQIQLQLGSYEEKSDIMYYNDVTWARGLNS